MTCQSPSLPRQQESNIKWKCDWAVMQGLIKQMASGLDRVVGGLGFSRNDFRLRVLN